MYIVRSNIFKPGTDTQRNFEKYKIQVAVVHRPNDTEFNVYLRSIDLHLHHLTGQYVAFFPFIDPSEEWLSSINNSHFASWWNYQQQFCLPFNDFLAQQVADFFSLDWNTLPALVISPSLWEGDFVTVETSTRLIEKQLLILTALSSNKENIAISDIAHTIKERLGQDAHVESGDMRVISSFYEFLETYNRNGNRIDPRYWQLIKEEFSRISSSLKTCRNVRQNEEINDEAIDIKINAARKALVAPAEVASVAYGHRSIDLSQLIPGFNGLESNSRLMIETAELVGWFLSFMNQRRKPWLRLQDFTPGAQGYWKSLELEINLSLIQAARLARGIEMPEYYARYKPDLPSANTSVATPRKSHNLNAEGDSREPGKHKFLMLGESYYVIKTMLDDSNEKLREVIIQYLGEPLQSCILDEWQMISQIRNKGSHINPLSEEDFNCVKAVISKEGIFQPLEKLKACLRD